MTQIPIEAVNGSVRPGAVDLGALRATREQKERLANQFLTQAGLLCPCGERIRGVPVKYFVLVEGQIPTPQGPQLGLILQEHTLHSPDCALAADLEKVALARREGAAGRVTWLDEKRAARAARQ